MADYWYGFIGLGFISVFQFVLIYLFLTHRNNVIEDLLSELSEKIPVRTLKEKIEKAHHYAMQVKMARDAMTQIHDLTNPIHHYDAIKVVPDIHEVTKRGLAVLAKERLE